MNLKQLLSVCSLADLTRIDVGLEGDWNSSARTVWTRQNRILDVSEAPDGHEDFKPSIELYFSDGWIGLHCFCRRESMNVLDRERLEAVVSEVEAAIFPDGR